MTKHNMNKEQHESVIPQLYSMTIMYVIILKRVEQQLDFGEDKIL